MLKVSGLTFLPTPLQGDLQKERGKVSNRGRLLFRQQTHWFSESKRYDKAQEQGETTSEAKQRKTCRDLLKKAAQPRQMATQKTELLLWSSL